MCPEMPVLKKFPYETTIECQACWPTDRESRPRLICKMEIKREGTQVQRVLECPCCEGRDDDVFDVVTQRTMFNRKMDDAAMRGASRKKGPGSDIA